MCKVSDKFEMVDEIIGWFDMELPISIHISIRVLLENTILYHYAKNTNFKIDLLCILYKFPY